MVLYTTNTLLRQLVTHWLTHSAVYILKGTGIVVKWLGAGGGGGEVSIVRVGWEGKCKGGFAGNLLLTTSHNEQT